MSFDEDIRSFEVSEEELNHYLPMVTYVDTSFEEDVSSFEVSEDELNSYFHHVDRANYNRLQAIIASGDIEKTLRFINQNNISEKTYRNVPINEGYSSPLIAAARSGMFDMARCLLDLGLDFKHPTETPPVHCAAFQGHLSIVQLLESYGFRLDDADINGDTPLFHAAKGNQKVVMRYLLESGCDVNHINNRRDTLLQILIRIDSSFDNIQYIFSKGFLNVNYSDARGCTPLGSAMLRRRSLQVITFLLSQGADAVGCTIAKNPPFFIALICTDDVRILRALCNAGANPEWHPKDISPLSTAVIKNKMKYVRFLVKELNVRVDNLSKIGVLDAFMVSLETRNWDCALFLLKAGYNFSSFQQRLVRHQAAEWCEVNPDAKVKIETLVSLMSNPRSLQDICANFVRRRFGRQVFHKSQKLQIPANLVDYIRLDHL